MKLNESLMPELEIILSGVNVFIGHIMFHFKSDGNFMRFVTHIENRVFRDSD